MEPLMGLIASFGFNFALVAGCFAMGDCYPLLNTLLCLPCLALLTVAMAYKLLPYLTCGVESHLDKGRPGLSNYVMGQVAGVENTILLLPNMPAHNHQMMASGNEQTQNTATGASLASQGRDGVMPTIYTAGFTSPVPMASTTSIAGSNQPFSIIQPYLCINYCIAMEGIFPSRN